MGIPRKIVLALLCATSLRAEIVDRVVATVDGHVLTFSAALAEANYQAFRSRSEPVVTLEGDALKTVISKLADQQLLQNEKANSPYSAPDTGEAERAIQSLRQRFPGAAEFQRELVRYNLNEQWLLQRLKLETSILGFIDYRLRPQARVSPAAIETYYRNVLLPQLAKQGERNAPPLAQVSGEIERILTEQEINQLLDEWLMELRSRSRIRIVGGR
ncbi:MAG: hypothetical protein HYX72_05495 [Acidobacteria bacterium]|nr:hypothetical protein [Acidobacteriota bacterium]